MSSKVALLTFVGLIGWPSGTSAQESSALLLSLRPAPTHLLIKAAHDTGAPTDGLFTQRVEPPSKVQAAMAGVLTGALFGGIAGGLYGGSKDGCNQCDLWGATAGAFLGGIAGLTLALILY